MLYQYEDIELEVRYNPFDLSKIKVYDFGFYLCQLNSEILGNFPISNYDFSSIKKTIKTKYADSTISLKQYALEFKELVQIKCKE